MRAQYACDFPGRVAALRAAGEASPASDLNGITFLEVEPGQTQLAVHFVRPLSAPLITRLTKTHVEVRGGVRVRDPKVKAVQAAGDVLFVEVERPGDFSRYTLRLVASPAGSDPPEGIDPALAEVEFSFKVDCPSDFDCRSEPACPPARVEEPPIDYLAKDYTSFRRLMLDRLSTLLPGWRERSPADLWVTLVELLAFRADELSYFQDAVASEAYLGTARRRVSVRRHARLLDYPFHDGRNARAWLVLEVGAAADGQTLRGCDLRTGLGGTLFLTESAALGSEARVDLAQAQAALDAGAQAFEALHPLTLHPSHNEIHFYTWSDEECCLPKGATRAFLVDDADPARKLHLDADQVLVFEEVKSPVNGAEADADRSHRHAVRLRAVALSTDPLTHAAVMEVRWHAADALPFPLCLSARIEGRLERDIAVARGNVLLADHGRTLPDTRADPRPEALPEPSPVPPYRPLLRESLEAPVTQRGRDIDPAAPARNAFPDGLEDVRPAIELRDADRRQWTASRDLLAAGRFDAEFVVETEDDSRAYLRFGDGVNGRRPGSRLTARYRVGNGLAGNVGAEAIVHVVTRFDIGKVRNPLPARGGVGPHPSLQAKLYAPQAFRRQERAVTPADYSAAAERHPEVQRAVATRRWTGSWHTLFITVDRLGGAAIDPAFEAELRLFLDRFRLAGHDLEIDGPRFVPLDIAMDVCTRKGYFPADLIERLLQAFGRQDLPAAGQGFFHPDRFTFGAPVYLSALVARAMEIPGVSHVKVRRFQRWGRTPAGELDEGVIRLGRLEIARLDNDPNAPENGRIEFRVPGEA